MEKDESVTWVREEGDFYFYLIICLGPLSSIFILILREGGDMKIRNWKKYYQVFGISAVLLLVSAGCSRKPESAPSPSKPSLESRPLRAKSSPGAKVFFVNVKEGDTLMNPIQLVFGAEGIQIAPAGEVKDNSGHHHLLIDIDPLPPMTQPLPATERMQHFGKGQTETTLTLPPGPHTLQLLLAGGNHVPHDPPVMSEKIKVTVK